MKDGAIMENNSDVAKKALEDAVILIPSLEPDERLPAYVRKLMDSGFGHIVIVDDGSSESYQPIFREISGIDRTVVLHHDVNHGKGVALKTGYTWIMENLHGISGVITADADGQHTVEDCIRLAVSLESGERALYLGSRDFSSRNVPFRSRLGNRTTSTVFFLLYGKWLGDTQTGLRAFRAEDLRFMTEITGERFEYEMNVLIACVRAGLPIIPMPIETIYENENKGSHYSTFRDSARILKVIMGGFITFMGSSLLCVLIDQGLFNLINLVILGNGTANNATKILAATAVARIVSASVNFLLNKNFVFKLKGNSAGALWKYIVLSIANLLVSAGCVKLMTLLGIGSTAAKLIVDFILYFINYRIQRNWVFRERETNEKTA